MMCNIRLYLLHLISSIMKFHFLYFSRSASLCANSLGLPMYSMPVQSAPGSRRGSTTLYNQSLLTPNLPINDVNGRR